MFYALNLIRQYENLAKLRCLIEQWHEYSKEQTKTIAKLRAENRRLKKQIKELKSDLY